MAAVISSIIQWVVVPCIMLALFVYALVIASSVKGSEQKTSSWAGFWAGLVLFVVYVVSQLSLLREPDLGFSRLPGFLIVPMGLGLVIGFLFLWMVKVTVPTRLAGLITLLLSAVSTSALFTYIYINSLRVSVLYWALGTALGILFWTLDNRCSDRRIARIGVICETAPKWGDEHKHLHAVGTVSAGSVPQF
ncbi:MAG: hypothetical protein NT169_00045, partial [Chloroflexi bacterium]|nr:hypothetical protein [Chloroflexota bacterium]